MLPWLQSKDAHRPTRRPMSNGILWHNPAASGRAIKPMAVHEGNRILSAIPGAIRSCLAS
jgi:hypothetical protein